MLSTEQVQRRQRTQGLCHWDRRDSQQSKQIHTVKCAAKCYIDLMKEMRIKHSCSIKLTMDH